MENNKYIKELLNKFINTDENRIAFSLYNGQVISDINYRQFANDILNFAGELKRQGVCKEHIGIINENTYEWLVTFFAIIASGNISVSLNHLLPKEIIKNQCIAADVSVVCTGNDYSDFAEAIPDNVIVLPYKKTEEVTMLSIGEVYISAQDETSMLVFTSGTTGTSKIAEITARNLENAIESTAEIFSDESNRIMVPIPMFHIAGLRATLGILFTLKTICIGRGIKYIFMDMPLFNPTGAFLIPAIVDSMAKLLQFAKTPEDRAKIVGSRFKRIAVGGAALKSRTANYLLDLGYVISNAYGMTETTGTGMWVVLSKDRINALGKPHDNVECRIEDGEILFRGPVVVKQYYKDTDETDKVIKDGWLHTGDMGYLGDDGYYYMSGRKKNVIILSNGENVNPEEIEIIFGECDAVLECMVYSDGKGICADIYTEQKEIVADYIRLYNESMPMYRQVYKVNYLVTPLEKTGSGKIKRKVNTYV